ncbi:hypothetical protein M3J09_007500 [Ascochyta lentis]
MVSFLGGQHLGICCAKGKIHDSRHVVARSNYHFYLRFDFKPLHHGNHPHISNFWRIKTTPLLMKDAHAN